MTGSSPQPRPRLTGLVYLLYFLTAVSAGLLPNGLVVSGNPSATASNLMVHESLFRSGIALGLMATAWYIAMAALFYNLFKPVSRNLSLLAAFFNLVGCAIQASGILFQLAPLVVLGRSSSYLSTFSPGQLQALALLSLNLHSQVDQITLVFFGFYDLLIGYLLFKSAFLPRLLGLLMMIAGLGWLAFLAPPLAAALSPWIQILGFLAELALLLWLLIKGVNQEQWRPQ